MPSPAVAVTATGLVTRAPTENTGRPSVSAPSTVMLSGPAGAILTRSRAAPTAWRRTLFHAKGSRAVPSPPGFAPGSSTSEACSAASSSAGCRP